MARHVETRHVAFRDIFALLEAHTLKAEPWLREAGGTDKLAHAVACVLVHHR